MTKSQPGFLVLAAVILLHLTASAAEFDIDSGATLLRRLQLCSDCGSALLVTRVHPGVIVRCPDCGHDQSRLHDRYLITQVYQTCRLCQAPLDATNHSPGDTTECDNCHTRQVLTRDAFISAADSEGDGYLPGFPPGSRPKRLLLDPGAANDMAAAGLAIAPETPPPLPGPDSPVNTQQPPVLGIDDQGPAVAWIPEPRIPPPPANAPRPASPGTPQPDADTAVEVPAVSVDMFGGPSRRAATEESPAGIATTLLAKVDGQPIRLESVEVIVGPVIAAMRSRAKPEDAAGLAAREKELRAGILDRLIDRELAAAEAQRLGFKADPSEIRKKAAAIAPRLAGTSLNPDREAWLELSMAAMRRQFGERPEAVSPAQVREYYQAHKNEMLRPGGLAIATLIIFRDRIDRNDPRDHRDIAAEISARLEQGERFDALRAARDEFPQPAGGTTPQLLPEAYYAEEILAVIGGLREGAVFGPLFMPGLALFGKIIERRNSEPVPFQEVEKDIRQTLGDAEADRRFEEWLVNARKRTVVEIF